jgi:hypothetical protein
LLLAPLATAGGEVHTGPWPRDAKKLYDWQFDTPMSYRWEGFWESKNTFKGSGGAARAPATLTLSCALSGCRIGFPLNTYGRPGSRRADTSRIAANRHFGFAYYVQDCPALAVTFFNATKQALMTVRIAPLRQKQWTLVWFNLVGNLEGGRPFPQQVEVGDRLTKVTIRADPGGQSPLFLLDNVTAFEIPDRQVAPPARRVLPARTVNRVGIRLVLDEPATVAPGEVELTRFPGAKAIAVTFLYDQPRRPSKDLWEAKALKRHGWRGTWLLRAGTPEAAEIIPKLQGMGFEIGALPRSANRLTGGSYPWALAETMYARLALEPLVGDSPILSYEDPDSTGRSGYGPFWIGTDSMRAARDAGFLIQNNWGKYCYLGFLRPPYPRWGGDISTCMMQLYAERPGPAEPTHVFPGRPHEAYGWEEDYSRPLNGAREIYGKISEFGNSRAHMTEKLERILSYARRFDLGRVIVLKTLGIPPGARPAFEKTLQTYAGREDFWYATLGEIGTYEYLRSRSRVVPAGRAAGKQVELALEMADIEPRWVRASSGGLTVRVTKALDVKKVLIEGEAVAFRAAQRSLVFDVPSKCLLRRPLAAELKVIPRRMAIPDVGRIELRVTNPAKVAQAFEVEWTVPAGWGWQIGPDRTAGASSVGPGGGVSLEAGESRTLRYELKTTMASGFGLWPVTARLKVTTPEGVRYQYAAGDVILAPRVSVRTLPYLPLFIRPMSRAKVRVYLSRDRLTGPIRVGGAQPKRLPRFIHPDQPAKMTGTLRVRPVAGFRITPSRVSLDLPASGTVKLDFAIENTSAPPDPQVPFRFAPEIELDGIGRVKTAPDPVRVYVDPLLDYEPLDERGLVLYAGFDGNATPKTVLDPKIARQRWGPVVLRRPGRGRDGRGAPGFVPGKKGQALGNASAWFGTEKNFNTGSGSILFWWRLPGGGDRRVVEGGEYNIILVPGNLTGSWYVFWTYYLRGKLHVSFNALGTENHHIAATWPTDEAWHHVAITWDFFAKRLRIYIDGKLVDEDKDESKEWLIAPFQLRRHMRTFPGWKDYYMGEYGGEPPGGANSFKFGQVALSGGLRPREKVSLMDELHVFDRALTGKQIKAHIAEGK